MGATAVARSHLVHTVICEPDERLPNLQPLDRLHLPLPLLMSVRVQAGLNLARAEAKPLVVKILTMASPVCDPSSAWAKLVISELTRRMQPPRDDRAMAIIHSTVGRY